MKNTARFWNRGAEKYSRAPVKDVKSWDETLARTGKYLKPNDKVLEFGAGTGSTALRLHNSVSHYRATDFSSEMIKIANRKLQSSDADNLEFSTARIEDEASRQYDAVLAFNVLHLVDDVEQTARAVHNCLKDNGIFISKSACVSGKYALLRPLIFVMQCFGKAPHINAFSRQKLHSQIKSAGFEILETQNLPKGSMMEFVVARKI